MTGRSAAAGRPVRVLFLAWGYSIHAERRIQLLADDPGFEAVVVSPHPYRIPGARTIPLIDGAQRKAIAGRLSARLEAERSRRERGGLAGRVAWAAGRAASYLRVGGLLFRIGVLDGGVARSAMNSGEILRDIAVGSEDFRILRAAAAEFRPDVVFLQTLLYPCYLAFFLPGSYPVVITFWNGDVTWWAQWNDVERTIKRQLVVHGVRRAAAVTVNSSAALEACRELGAAPGKVHLIRYPGVDLARFSPAPKEEARKALGIGFRRVVLCPRGLGGYLNSDVILEAAARVARARPDVLFLFLSGVGGEKELARHRALAGGLGIGGQVRWEGQVSWERMPLYYNAADAMVSVSSRDSLPNCMLEAMACGVPVVMGDIPSLREWIVDGENGCLVPPRDPERLAASLLDLLAAPPERLAASTETARALVAREADARESGRRVKELVRRVAGGAP